MENDIEKSDVFWFLDYSILYRMDRITQFYPSPYMTFSEKLNSVVRLSFYFGILMLLFKGNYNVLLFPVLALLVTYYLWSQHMKTEIPAETRETFNGSYKDNQLKPTYDNPFMNPNLIVHDPATFLQPEDTTKKVRFDINHHIDTQEDVDIKEDIDNKFTARLYQDVGDIFGKENSQRQFYSTAVRTYPNDQSAFAKWCWGVEKACKDGDYESCLQYNNEIRGSASVEAIKAPGPASVNLRKDWF